MLGPTGLSSTALKVGQICINYNQVIFITILYNFNRNNFFIWY
jgi:hypothetical protein